MQATTQLPENEQALPSDQIHETVSGRRWLPILIVAVCCLLFLGLGLFVGSQYSKQLERVSTTPPINTPEVTPTNSALPGSQSSPGDVDQQLDSSESTYYWPKAGLTFSYPKGYFVHEAVGTNGLDLDLLVITDKEIYSYPDGTDAPVGGIVINFGGCTSPEIPQSVPCVRTPAEMVSHFEKIRVDLIDETVVKKEIIGSGRTGQQISGVVSPDNQGAGSYMKATFFPNMPPSDGKYLIAISLPTFTQPNSELDTVYEKVIASLRFSSNDKR